MDNSSSSSSEDTPKLTTLIDFSLSSDNESESILTHSSSTTEEDDCSRLPETKDHYCRFNNRRLEQFGKDLTPETPRGEERHFTMFYSAKQAEYKLMLQKKTKNFL